jgi:Tfp pilus assembly protein PilF
VDVLEEVPADNLQGTSWDENMLGLRQSVVLVISLLSLSVHNSSAQGVGVGRDSSQVGSIQVHVVYANNSPASRHLRVRLMNGPSSTTISESFTNEQGAAQFVSIPIGEYHVVVSGEGIQEADSGEFEVDRRKMSQSIYITVQPIEEGAADHVEPGQPSVSKAELAIPSRARKESDRAAKAMTEQDWAKALEHLQRAIEIYPDYTMVYNNLGVVYGRLNDSKHERAAFQKAIDVDSHFAPAYVNLAKLSLREQDPAGAENLLESANQAEPNNAETMMLLAQAQLLNKHYDAAIRTSRDVHAIPHENLAVIHYIAARAMERANRPQDALVELQTFLTEEPKGARADHVRDEIAQLRQKPN